MLLTIPKSLENDIINFVKINNIENINDFLVNCLRNGLNISKYGFSPKDNFEKENKPLKIEKYENTEEINSTGMEEKGKGKPKKQSAADKEIIESVEKEEESVKPKKTIKIIKK